MAFDDMHLAALSADESASVKRLLEKGITIPPQLRVLRALQQNLARGLADARVLSRIIVQDPRTNWIWVGMPCPKSSMPFLTAITSRAKPCRPSSTMQDTRPGFSAIPRAAIICRVRPG
jgi:hypothetical protein